MQFVKESVCSIDQLPREVRSRVERTTNEILHHWKKSAENIIEVGHGLARLKVILPGKLYSEHIRVRLGMSGMQAHRLVEVARRFGQARSQKVLHAKPSVLYLLASSTSTATIDHLARGGRVQINGTVKSIDELRVDEAVGLSKKRSRTKPFSRLSDYQLDKKRCKIAYRQIGTIAHDLTDWAEDLKRFKSRDMEIPNQYLLLEALRESRRAVDELLRQLV